MRGTRKTSGKYIFIPSSSHAEAKERRNTAIAELNSVKMQLEELQRQEADWKEEIGFLNKEIRRGIEADTGMLAEQDADIYMPDACAV